MGEALRPDDPRQLGRFTLLERLGEGGQGIVYLGRADDSPELVAVKVLKAADAEARGRLEREMNAALQVRLRYCIARVIGFSFEGTRPYIVTEYVDGPSLFDRVADQGPLRGGDLERLMVFTAHALVTIHGSGIVHRDLKPANVLLGRDGPRVVDFGIARHVDHHTRPQLMGTPSYLAPELLREEQASRASDIWAWACTMAFAATGHPPFGPFDGDGSNVAAILGRIMHAEPRLGDGLEEFAPLVMACLDKNPLNRPTARQLRDRLESALEADLPHGESSGPLPFAPPSTPPAFTPGSSWAVPSVDGGPFARPTPATFPPIPVGVATPQPFAPPPPAQGGSRKAVKVVLGALLAVAVAVAVYFGVFAPGSPGDPTGPGGGGDAVVPAALAGTWTGGLTVSGGTYYRVKITLFAGQPSGQSELENGDLCSGTLTVREAAADSVELDLVHTAGSCPSGVLTMAVSGDGSAALAFTGGGESGEGAVQSGQ
ncbi:serine/threonine-protein kinase [Actinocorallia sp. A-T 12471]|uniref:serine/threonine-protein kinase n=1 Tax=Actinocorallia sp. A-T 12471 TaxID=3089813 RepID=UPI0029D2621B|nr:serine/threonine-protein kinase [Actinocorallia sp. A-T 12471]MDX6738971.1 serine/threonine-protein kinase [Actinocorallia sp. A-T 12471]